MNYCNVGEEEKQHLLKLVDWMYHEVLRSGGDGDAMWYSRYYNINDIKLIVDEYNSKLKYPWEVISEGNRIDWGSGQEWAIITNNKELLDNSPEWIQAKIYY